MGYAPFSFFIPGNYFVNQRHSILEFPEFCDRDSPSNVSTVENQTSKERLPKNQTKQVIWREADLVKDEFIHLYSSQFGDGYEYKENGII